MSESMNFRDIMEFYELYKEKPDKYKDFMKFVKEKYIPDMFDVLKEQMEKFK